MARVRIDHPEPSRLPRGVDLTLIKSDNTPIAVFGAAINSGNILAGGEMKAHLLVPFEQIPNLMPVFQYTGGIVFKITVERVARDELPEGGW